MATLFSSQDEAVGASGVRRELLEASDETIADAVSYADPMVLRGLIYQLTGDEALVDMEVGTVGRAGFVAMVAPTSEEDLQLIRNKAVEFLKAYRDSGAGPIDIGSEARLLKSLDLAAGREIEPAERERWLEELGLNPWARGLEWKTPPPADRLANFSVTVIGAGMGGINAAIHLKRAGIPFTVLEKNSGIGGTWYENRYPGARVDSPSRVYTHVFGADYNYPNPFCPWTENQKYFEWVADTFDMRGDITFNTEVRSMAWDEEASMWDLEVSGPDGTRTIRSNAVITAVGFLNRPKMPDIEGMADFKGPSWHTARWPDAVNLSGKRVAVIGTGCSGYQMIAELALEVGHLTIFQRTPQWLFAAPGYRSPFPPQVNWLDRNLPFHTNFMRFRQGTGFGGTFRDAGRVDPDFEDPYAVSEGNKAVRDGCIAFLEEKLGDPELVKKMTPPHPVMSARPVLVDPEWSVLDAIQQENVTLVTEGIDRIVENGVLDKDGTVHEVDVIIYATGFNATEYLFPMSITGRGGKTVEELWSDGGARAYIGAMITGVPNLWTLYGPNTNGGLVPPAFQEMETVYALRCIERMILDDVKSIDVKPEAYWAYNEIVDERNLGGVIADPRAHNYYWTRFGRSATQCPFSPQEMWDYLHEPNWDDLEVR